MPKLEDADQPLIFLFAVTLGVVAFIALGSALFMYLGWTGPLGLLKGGATR